MTAQQLFTRMQCAKRHCYLCTQSEVATQTAVKHIFAFLLAWSKAKSRLWYNNILQVNTFFQQNYDCTEISKMYHLSLSFPVHGKHKEPKCQNEPNQKVSFFLVEVSTQRHNYVIYMSLIKMLRKRLILKFKQICLKK